MYDVNNTKGNEKNKCTKRYFISRINKKSAKLKEKRTDNYNFKMVNNEKHTYEKCTQFS